MVVCLVLVNRKKSSEIDCLSFSRVLGRFLMCFVCYLTSSKRMFVRKGKRERESYCIRNLLLVSFCIRQLLVK